MDNKSALKWFKKAAVVAVVMMAMVLIVPAAGKLRRLQYKKTIHNLVIENLTSINGAVKDGEYDKILDLQGIEDIHFWKNDSEGIIVEYFCKGTGIAPAGTYSGFYYSSADEPVGYQGVSHNFTRTKNGWRWNQPDGDNYDYTEKITDYWYYYESGF